MNLNLNWKQGLLIMGIFILFILLAMSSGCSLFQMSPADKIASLPETPQQQLFQTIAKTNWLFTLSVVGMGAGFFAFLNGSSKGLQFMAACFMVISVIIGVTRYSAVIAMLSMIGTVCLMIYSVVVKNKAMREVVEGVQDVRDMPLNDTIYNELADRMDGVLDEVQSKTTKAIVKIVKNKL